MKEFEKFIQNNLKNGITDFTLQVFQQSESKDTICFHIQPKRFNSMQQDFKIENNEIVIYDYQNKNGGGL